MAAATQDATVAEKLRALYELQLIDSEIDQIQIMKGELPMEVSDLRMISQGWKPEFPNWKLR